jgi:U3 small nucleolar ribonucleoprotein component
MNEVVSIDDAADNNLHGFDHADIRLVRTINELRAEAAS